MFIASAAQFKFEQVANIGSSIIDYSATKCFDCDGGDSACACESWQISFIGVAMSRLIDALVIALLIRELPTKSAGSACGKRLK